MASILDNPLALQVRIHEALSFHRFLLDRINRITTIVSVGPEVRVLLGNKGTVSYAPYQEKNRETVTLSEKHEKDGGADIPVCLSSAGQTGMSAPPSARPYGVFMCLIAPP
jgi:hypothetical protein